MPLPKRHCLVIAIPLLLLGMGVRAAPDGLPVRAFKPLTPEQSQPLRRSIPLISSQAQHGPGDIIPPCIIAYGWTTRGLTDQHGRLITGQPSSVPRWTDVSAAKHP